MLEQIQDNKDLLLVDYNIKPFVPEGWYFYKPVTKLGVYVYRMQDFIIIPAMNFKINNEDKINYRKFRERFEESQLISPDVRVMEEMIKQKSNLLPLSWFKLDMHYHFLETLYGVPHGERMRRYMCWGYARWAVEYRYHPRQILKWRSDYSFGESPFGENDFIVILKQDAVIEYIDKLD